jgi:hypothetical protein
MSASGLGPGLDRTELPGQPLFRLAAPHARDKGLAPWRFSRATGLAEQRPAEGTLEAAILADIEVVLTRYQAHLPLGPRTIVYQLLPRWVGADRPYADKEALRKMVDRVLGKARRARIVPFASIDDQRTTWDGPSTVDELPGIVEGMQVGRQDGQPYRVEVWIETRGNVSRIARICRPYGVDVFSGSGSVPIGANLAAARRVIRSEQPTLMLVLGDFDPAGIKNIAMALVDDVKAFVDHLGGDSGRLVIRHLAMTETQARSMPELAREPVKDPPADWPLPFKVELEAIPPDELDRLVEDALAQVRDEAAYQRTLEAEPGGRVAALETLARQLRNGVALLSESKTPAN